MSGPRQGQTTCYSPSSGAEAESKECLWSKRQERIDEFGHPLDSEASSQSMARLTEEEPKVLHSYFNQGLDVAMPSTMFTIFGLQRKSIQMYDRLFHLPFGYNSKLHRDDRMLKADLDIYAEEVKRAVPVRSSSFYGRLAHKSLEEPARNYVRINRVIKDFAKHRGIGIPTSMD